ncbi:MAG: hypothetical protein OXN15_04005 [Chloroflexota bacterium]|nr:hypothetical protein [Chloroflexota bacterium]MDE2968876.1 hypothetical protein [Chloroflexota bacterium]
MTAQRTRGRSATVDGAPAAEAQDTNVAEITHHLRQSVENGLPWREALLQAMEQWTLPEETYGGLHRRYLLLGEAFDWLLLARRLGSEVAGLVPEDERRADLHSGRFLLEMPVEDVRRLLGVTKYRSYLNYWYGVTVEQALQIAVQREVRKERYSLGTRSRRGLTDAVFGKIYGRSRAELLAEFRAEWPIAGLNDAPGTELKAFTYWLFKLRVYRSDPARVASDTRKALEWLHARLGTLPTVAAEELAAHLAAHRR